MNGYSSSTHKIKAIWDSLTTQEKSFIEKDIAIQDLSKKSKYQSTKLVGFEKVYNTNWIDVFAHDGTASETTIISKYFYGLTIDNIWYHYGQNADWDLSAYSGDIARANSYISGRNGNLWGVKIQNEDCRSFYGYVPSESTNIWLIPGKSNPLFTSVLSPEQRADPYYLPSWWQMSLPGLENNNPSIYSETTQGKGFIYYLRNYLIPDLPSFKSYLFNYYFIEIIPFIIHEFDTSTDVENKMSINWWFDQNYYLRCSVWNKIKKEVTTIKPFKIRFLIKVYNLYSN